MLSAIVKSINAKRTLIEAATLACDLVLRHMSLRRRCLGRFKKAISSGWPCWGNRDIRPYRWISWTCVLEVAFFVVKPSFKELKHIYF
jgi:hypothetical protein